jgi:phage-related minor tail protein
MQSGVARFAKSAEAGLRRVDRMAGRVSRTLRTGLRQGLTVATAAIGGTLAATQRLANQADDLGKRTRDLQFPIEEFQQWRFAAGQAGIDGANFDKSLEAMSRRLGQAQAGTGTMESRLSDLHPELLQSMKDAENSADALAAYRRAMQDVEDPSRRAAITAAIFSNSGQDMQRMAHMTEAALQDLMRTQRENGVVTREQADAAELFNDTVAELTGSLTGLMRDALLPLLPALTELAAGAREWVQANREMIVDRVLHFFELIQGNIGEIITWFGRFAASIGVWFALTGALKVAIAVFTLFNLVMAANPIVLIVVGVFALIAAITALVMWLRSVIDWTELFASIGQSMTGFFAAAFEGLVAGLRALWDGFVAFWSMIFDGVMAIIQVVVDFIANAMGGLVDILKGSWGGFAGFWGGLWEGIQNTVSAVIDFIQPLIDRVMGGINAVREGAARVAGFFGFGDDDDEDEQAQRQRGGRGGSPVMASPQERTAREISETRTEDHSTVTIRDESGRAEQTGGRRRGGGVRLEQSGAF